VLEVAGPLEHSDTQLFRGQLESVAADPAAGPLIVDLSALELICCASMRLLVQCQRTLADNGLRMITVGLNGNAREAVEISGIDTLLETAPSLEDAFGALQSASS